MTVGRPSAEPASSGDLRGLLLDYLDFYRSVIATKRDGLDPRDLRESRLPSGWTPAGLINHLTYMERRWLLWGFLGEPVTDPWGDSADAHSGDGWVTPDEDLTTLVTRLHATGARTGEIVEAHTLDEVAAVGGRFTTVSEAPQLHWILLHVLQEYARHAGHLDIVRELIDGTTGEEA